jgi:hypothetical protein
VCIRQWPDPPVAPTKSPCHIGFRSTCPEALWVSSTAMTAAPKIAPHTQWRKIHDRPCPF